MIGFDMFYFRARSSSVLRVVLVIVLWTPPLGTLICVMHQYSALSILEEWLVTLSPKSFPVLASSPCLTASRPSDQI